MLGFFRVLLYLRSMCLGVGEDGGVVIKKKKKKRRTLNSVDDEQNLLDAVVEYGVRKKSRERICALNAAVKGIRH